MNKRIIFLVMLGIFLISIISAQEVSYCCESTNSGAWCQNSPGGAECDSDYLSAPTSCDATSYCRLGVCISSEEGICMPNSPERVCIDGDGTWDLRKEEEIPQCQLGCCLLGDQAAFVTLTRCRSLASAYGLEIDYRTDITSEIACIGSASPEEKGACVFEKETERNCEMLTKKECQERDASVETEFYEGYLCSAEALGTICAPRGGTTCVDGKDEVYFKDTCGNIANVYNYDKLNDLDYWTYIRNPTCTVGVNGARKCGNCDYVGGNTCKKPERGNSPSYGNYICEDLSCTYNNQPYSHGETWCAKDKANENVNSPGGSNSRLICYNGEVTVEPCAEFRQEVCIQDEVNGFTTADCRVNKWQDCYSQTNKEDCENEVQRYCQWKLKDDTGGHTLVKEDEDGNAVGGSCIPLYAPGFNFWEEGDAESVCGLASTQCRVLYGAGVTKLLGLSGPGYDAAYDLDCVENCRVNDCFMKWDDPMLLCKKYCLGKCPSKCVDASGKIKEDWKNNANKFCVAMGDCGNKENWIGKDGYYTKLDKLISRSNVTAEE